MVCIKSPVKGWEVLAELMRDCQNSTLRVENERYMVGRGVCISLTWISVEWAWRGQVPDFLHGRTLLDNTLGKRDSQVLVHKGLVWVEGRSPSLNPQGFAQQDTPGTGLGMGDGWLGWPIRLTSKPWLAPRDCHHLANCHYLAVPHRGWGMWVLSCSLFLTASHLTLPCLAVHKTGTPISC